MEPPSTLRRYIVRFLSVGTWVCAVAGCEIGVSAEPERVQTLPLIDHMQWRSYSLAEDPLPEHQPAAIDCGVAGVYPEEDGLEIDTGRCNYVMVEQPARVALPVGTTIAAEWFHFDLTAPTPSEAHVAVLFDRALQWEETIPIPGPAATFEGEWTLTERLEEGDLIRLHLHNHGQNTWTLVSLSY